MKMIGAASIDPGYYDDCLGCRHLRVGSEFPCDISTGDNLEMLLEKLTIVYKEQVGLDSLLVVCGSYELPVEARDCKYFAARVIKHEGETRENWHCGFFDEKIGCYGIVCSGCKQYEER
jgi:hypothetical protein